MNGRQQVTGLYFCVLLVLLFVLSACSHSRVKYITQTNELLIRGKAVYVTLPPDKGKFFNDENIVSGSGKALQASLGEVISEYASNVILASEIETRVPALESARSCGADYVFISTLLGMERDGQRVDMAEGYITVFKVSSGKQMFMRFFRVKRGIEVFDKYPDNTLMVVLPEMTGKMFSRSPVPLTNGTMQPVMGNGE